VFAFLNQRPSALLGKRYDRPAIFFSSIAGLFYLYTPYIFGGFFKDDFNYQQPDIYFRWIPIAIILIFYLLFPKTLYFDKIYSLLIYLGIGAISYLLNFFIVGFGIIDFAWYIFFYVALGALIFIRRIQRESIQNTAQLKKNINTIPLEVITQFKNDWHLLLTRFIQTYFAIGTLLAACMSILLTREINGAPAWRDWSTLINAIRMAFLFVLVSCNYFIFFLSPLLETMGLYQKLFILKYTSTPQSPDG